MSDATRSEWIGVLKVLLFAILLLGIFLLVSWVFFGLFGVAVGLIVGSVVFALCMWVGFYMNEKGVFE